MSAIVTHFKIPITKEQAAQIRNEWERNSGNERAMLVIQPIGMTTSHGIKDERSPSLNCCILDEELALAFSELLIAHKKARP